MSYVRLFVCVLARRAICSFRLSACPQKHVPQNSPVSHGALRVIRGNSGLTLVELAVTLALLSVLMAMSMGALSYYMAGRSLDGAVSELSTQIREAQQLAVATGNTYRIDFSDANRLTYTLQRRQGSEWINVREPLRLPGVEFSASSLPQFGADRYMEFYARGTSESGTIVVEDRFGRSRIITVDGETVNVR
ncbi:MAG: prepilin-type N-terminal cleavage/methylation domain-containing protein [Actinobacteria bacterium]|nr:prepilin-type N-terminal cleavage/methylation domain-containing protein [Actinomycetota bacterium]